VAQYAASSEIIVYLISQEVNGSSERKLAAKFLLECLRRFHSREDIAACLNELEGEAMLDVSRETRRLAEDVGLSL
jgi:hypothetical protein